MPKKLSKTPELSLKMYMKLVQMQPSIAVLIKRWSKNKYIKNKNMQQIYRRTPMLKYDFNKLAKQLYWNHTSAWVLSCKFAIYFQNIFLWEHVWKAASISFMICESIRVSENPYSCIFHAMDYLLWWSFLPKHSTAFSL